MRADELYKFSDGTLNDVRFALHDIAVGIRMEYLPMRKWSNLDKKRARVMVRDIDKQLYQRRLMRNLENQNQRDLPTDILLDSVVVLRYEKRSKSENKGIVLTEMQQGTSHEVSIVKTSNNLRVLRIILVILPEHQSGTKVFTMTMEILLEPTSNKLMIGRSSRIRRLYKDGCGDFRYSDTVRPSESDEVLKLKNLKKDVLLLKFSSKSLKKSMSMSVQKSQVHKMEKITRWRKEIMLG
ncbi:hypothetical protein Tco_0992121 [Tanacetum coccineum]|uniref:Uncharacterized protein n=1 Tax=Tanacetum coccineum TaxID=301880 RepID=A0ABQ5F2Q1_9ASTR